MAWKELLWEGEVTEYPVYPRRTIAIRQGGKHLFWIYTEERVAVRESRLTWE